MFRTAAAIFVLFSQMACTVQAAYPATGTTPEPEASSQTSANVSFVQASTSTDETCTPGVTFLTAHTDADWWNGYSTIITTAAASINAFWSGQVPQTWGADYRPPCVITEYEPASVPYQDMCGITPETAQSNAFYCASIHGVMWDGPTFFWPIYGELGDMAVVFIMAHEIGHAVQFTNGELPDFSIARELQADCYAGAYIQYAEQQGALEPGDYREIATIIAAVGDPRQGFRWYTPGTHGTALQREAAFLAGYRQGVSGCSIENFQAQVEQAQQERPGTLGDRIESRRR